MQALQTRGLPHLCWRGRSQTKSSRFMCAGMTRLVMLDHRKLAPYPVASARRCAVLKSKKWSAGTQPLGSARRSHVLSGCAVIHVN